MVSRLGKYLLLEHVNQGGMADVFLAKTFGFGGADQLIALKCIRPEVQANHDFITMFIDEAKLSALLSHANIAKTFELGRIDNSYFIAMEYVSGRDLRALVDRARARGMEIPVGLALFIIASVLEGLDYAHRKADLKGQPLRIVHSDVSPRNVLVGYAGEVKLIDFGIARAAQGPSATEGHGKLGYMSPEQVRGEAVDARSDLFAVGSLMFELLTRSRLFDGASDTSVRDKVKNAEIFPPTLVAPSLPPDIEAIVMRALARRPDDRYPNAESMHREIVEAMLRHHGQPQPRELGNFVRRLFDEEHREDLARIERAMNVQTTTEGASSPDSDSDAGAEPTRMVNVAKLAPLIEETTSPEATRFASILPSGVILTHPFAKPAAAAAAAAAATAAANSAPPKDPAMTPPVVGPVTTGESAAPDPQAPAPRESTARAAEAAVENAMSRAAAEQTSSWESPTVGQPAAPAAKPALAPRSLTVATPLKPQPMTELERTDVDDEPDGDTAVVARDAGTDPRAMRFDTDRHLSLPRTADVETDEEPNDGDTAIVRTDGTRIASLHDVAQPDEDDFTDRIHKSLAILGVHEDSDAGLEPTQVAFKADALRQGPTPQGAAPISAGTATVPPPAKVRRGTVESLAAIGITPAPAAGDDDVDDSTDRVMRSGGGALEQVPREVTIIDHSRRTAGVDDWAREARGQRRSGLRRVVLFGLVGLLVAGGGLGLLWLRANGRLPRGAYAVGGLVVISQPAGAEVLMDGVVVGTTPFSSQRVPTGHHQIVIRGVSGRQRAIEIQVREREVVTREVNLLE
ncbi:MAG: protein kinase [Myxococcota bacterium]